MNIRLYVLTVFMLAMNIVANAQTFNKARNTDRTTTMKELGPERFSERRWRAGGRETLYIGLRHEGELVRKLSPEDRRYVTRIVIEGTLNDADYRLLAELGKRSKMLDDRNKEVTAYIDIDLSRTDYYNGKKVVDIIPSRAFSDCAYLRTIILPDYLKEIGDNAFESCKSLDAVSFPSGLRVIGRSAFRFSGINYVELPRSVEIIGSYAFADTKIETAIIGADVRECPINAFKTNVLKNYDVEPGSNLYSSRDGVLFNVEGTEILDFPHGRGGRYVMPEGVVAFSGSAFSYNRNIVSVTLPESLVSLPESAFEECSGLASINIPSRITLIPKNAFRGCKAIVDYVVPENITYIGQNAFRACKGMRSIVLPKALKTIEEEAFYYCEKLLNVEIPSSVVTIGKKAFYHCDAMTEMTFRSATPPSMEKINDNPKKLIIVVPEGAQSTYSSLETLKKHQVR